MGTVLVIRHVPHEGLGTIQPALAAAGLNTEILDSTTQPGHTFLTRRFSGTILLGGPMSANDPAPYLTTELYLIEAALRNGTPLLGVCLGAQLIAKAMGARVYPNPVKEIGWFPVEKTAAAAGSLLESFAPSEDVFHWHGETFDLPAGTAWLARSAACPNQAFRAGDRVYGLQFHLEVTPEMIEEWLREDAACGDAREAEGPIDPGYNRARLGELSEAVFGGWARMVAEAAEAEAPRKR